MTTTKALCVAGFLVAGCAGQLDLAPEAYLNKAAEGSGGSTGSGMGPWDAAPKPEVSVYGPTWVPDAGVSEAGGGDGGAWAETGSMPAPMPDAAPASVCPPGVDALSLLAKRCGSCHGERMPAKMLDLVTPGLADRTVGVKSTCGGRPLLDINAPAGKAVGFLLEKLDGAVNGCGAQMPYGTPPIVGAERECLTEWAVKVIARKQGGN
jgi:hypothetical protein